MTKEVMRLKFSQGKLSINEFDEFFEANVVVPKGKNRHPYADVLHRMAEGEEFQQWDYGEEKWINSSKRLYYDEKYRIKPSEPVYEWQWVDINDKGIAYIMCDSKFKTDYEIEEYASYRKPLKIEETKRERKQ